MSRARPLSGKKRTLTPQEIILVNDLYWTGGLSYEQYRKTMKMSCSVIERYRFQRREDFEAFKAKHKNLDADKQYKEKENICNTQNKN